MCFIMPLFYCCWVFSLSDCSFENMQVEIHPSKAHDAMGLCRLVFKGTFKKKVSYLSSHWVYRLELKPSLGC